MKTLSVLVLGCLLGVGCATAWRANQRAAASDLLASCLSAPPGRPWNEKECMRQAAQFCTERFLEPNCAVDGMWNRDPFPRRRW